MTALWIIAIAMCVVILLWAVDTIALVRYTAAYRKRRKTAARTAAKPGYDHRLCPGDCLDQNAGRCDH